jgi:hypothetical protein
MQQPGKSNAKKKPIKVMAEFLEERHTEKKPDYRK